MDQAPPPPEEDKKQESEKKPFKQRLKEDERIKQGVDFLWARRIEFFSGALLLIGIILAFFYIHIGGTLVGLGFGVCFFDEIHSYFLQLRDLYTEQGLFKTVMWVGTIVYFLIAIPAFIIASAIGYGVMYLIRWSLKTRK